MRLQRLTGLEREKLVEEYQEVLAHDRAPASEILASEQLVLEIIAAELREHQRSLRRQAPHRDHPRDAARSRSRT